MTDVPPTRPFATRRTILALAPGFLAGCSLDRVPDSPATSRSVPATVYTSPIPLRDPVTPASAVVATIPMSGMAEDITVAVDGVVYLTDRLRGKVVGIQNRRIIKTIDVGVGVDGVATADGRVYAAGGGRVSIITNLEVTHTILVDDFARRIVLSSDGTGYVAHFLAQGLISILRDEQPAGKIPVAAYPSKMAIAPDNTVYVSHDSAEMLTQINGDKVTRTIRVPDRVADIAVDPDGTLYVSSVKGVHVIRDGRVTETIEVSLNGGAGPLAIGDSGYGYVCVGIDRAIKVIQNNQVTGFMAFDGAWNVSSIAIAPDGTGYVGTTTAKELSVLA